MDIATIATEKRLFGPATIKRRLAPSLKTDRVALNYYELEPDDSFAFGYHKHESQEEIFYIQQGSVTFYTEEGTRDVSAGQCVRFAPGEFQRGINEGDERVVALAMGVPQEATTTEILRDCPSCGAKTHQTIEFSDNKDALYTICLNCNEKTGRFEYGEVPLNSDEK